MSRAIKIILTIISFILLFSCEKEKMNSSGDSVLRLSASSITFDTVFASMGSAVKNLRVANLTNSTLNISSIKLAGGEGSDFKLNINGEVVNEKSNVKIPPNDSIYIFVEATMSKNNSELPLVAEDSILFSVENKEQKVKLIAWGQDFNLIKSEVIKTSVWTSEKPYLVYNYAWVDSGQVLTIEPGTKVYFHGKAGLYVKGTLIVKGTLEEPVEFKGDQPETLSTATQEKWNGIILFSGSHNNKIDYAIIKDANIGLQVGTIEHTGFASVALSNSLLENMEWSGIWAMKSKIIANNCVISNVRYYNTALLLGGDYQFYHTTFANYYNNPSAGMRTTETLVISNYLVDNKTGVRYVGDMKEALFGNCIITGNRANELLISMDRRGGANYLFDHSLIQVADTFKIPEPLKFNDVLMNINPRFKDPYRGNFELDTLSVVKDFGKLAFAKLYPNDIKGISRILDGGPDLGAFERVENKTVKKATGNRQ
jgi:hypothetical protein